MNELEYSNFLKEETDLEREAGLILEHHGIKGQRWGIRRSPEQLGHKKKESMIKGAISSVKKRAANAKKASAKKRAIKAKAQEKKQEESNEEIRKKLLSSTDPAFIYKYRQLLDSKELQDRIDRITKEQKIKDLIPNPNAKRKKQIKKGEETLRSMANMAESVGKLYDTYNKISGGNTEASSGNKPSNQNTQKKSQKKSQKKKDEKAKAAKQLFSDPGMQALLDLGMVTPADRKDISERAREENEKRKKSWGTSS